MRPWYEPEGSLPPHYAGSHDLVGEGYSSLLLIAPELRRREAVRKAQAIRRRTSWRSRLLAWGRSKLRQVPAPLPSRCVSCAATLAGGEILQCDACLSRETDALVMRRLEELSTSEAVAFARGISHRDGDLDMSKALHALLLVHSTGDLGSVRQLSAHIIAIYEETLGPPTDKPGEWLH